MNLQQMLMILKARYKITLLTMLAIMGITLGVSLMLPPRYSAETDLIVDMRSQDPLAQIAMYNADMSYLPTQIDVINSERVVQKVIKILKLDQNPAVRQKWMEDTGGEGQLTQWLGDLLQKDMKAKPSRDSNVIMISYSSPDPGFSAAVANAFAQAYVETNLDLKTEPAHEYATWFKDQGKDLRADLEKAQAKLSAYQQKHGMVITDERLDAETAKLADLTAQLTAAELVMADARSKQRSGGNASTLPEVQQNALILNLKADIDRAEAKLQDAAGNYGKNHPQYKRMEAELNMLKQKLAAETAHIASGFTTSENVGTDKAAQLRQLIEIQKAHLLEMRRQRDDAAVLLADVASAQKAYDAVTARLTQTSLESQARQTNISVLTPATAPIKPTSPQPVLYTAIAGVLGLLIGLGMAFMTEMMDRRVRTIEDVELGVGLPVLARITRQQGSARLFVKKLRLRRPRTIEFA
ncbi:chain-length determining protein [Novimethylophilus kurashikiensis]|uniref:Chain-length determining protein n=1 Tax=Novimethylophilus kurashikiensis TaxID=1825523 RepID=A0A2R5FF25_9PROT|nr:chain length determinant protein EpsF [Novimethylophilus kurashikiensis]GBG14994.1 chain-length determining protein [Novimethylophilus kurashikiensis]